MSCLALYFPLLCAACMIVQRSHIFKIFTASQAPDFIRVNVERIRHLWSDHAILSIMAFSHSLIRLSCVPAHILVVGFSLNERESLCISTFEMSGSGVVSVLRSFIINSPAFGSVPFPWHHSFNAIGDVEIIAY